MENHKRLKIGIDIDGVLSNFIKKYREICMEITGRILPVESIDWDQSNWGLTPEQHRQAWEVIKNTDNFYYKLEVLDGVSKGKLSRLDDLHTLVFVTTRAGTKGLPTEKQTAYWLEDNLFLSHTNVLVSNNKGELAKALQLDAFIDDGPQNILSILQSSPNTRMFVRDQLYNRRVEGNYVRVKDFNEFEDIILGE